MSPATLSLSVVCLARASGPCRGLRVPSSPASLLLFSTHSPPAGVSGLLSHEKRTLCMRLDCSTAEGPLTGRLGSLRRHLVGKTHPARHVRLGAALLGPFRPPQSQRQSLLPSKPPPPSFTARLLPSPQAPAAPASVPTVRCRSFQGLPTRASFLELSARNPLPAPPELAAHLVHGLHSGWFTGQASRGICSSIPFLHPG